MSVRVWSINGVTPVVDPTAFVHPSAVLIGDVLVAAGCYVGPSACLRGDFGRIELRAGANVQDCCVMHGFPGTDTVVEEEGHIGHGAILHGCVVQKNALVGMNAVVNDNAVIGESAIVAAMAFVKAGMVVPPRTLVAGVPAFCGHFIPGLGLTADTGATALGGVLVGTSYINSAYDNATRANGAIGANWAAGLPRRWKS